MSIKLKKYSILIIAAVLLIAMAFAGAASADNWTDAGNFNETWYDAEGGESPASDTYHIYDAASLAALAEKVSINSTIEDFSGKTIIIMNDIDLSGHDWIPIGTYAGLGDYLEFSGNFTGDGYGKTISNYTISANYNSFTGLIGIYTGSKISNLTLRDFNVTPDTYGGLLGGLVGWARPDSESTFENVCAKFGTVSGLNAVGGLVGGAYPRKINFVNCTVENCMIAASDFAGDVVGAGGLVGYAHVTSCFDNSSVKNCSVSGSVYVGGLVGCADSASTPAFMRACNVTNCIISARSEGVGGLVGFADSASASGIAQCVVEDCMIVSARSEGVGGLVGVAESTSVFNAGDKLLGSVVRGNNSVDDYVGKIVGADNVSSGGYSKKDIDSNVTQNSIWLNNDSNANYPKIYIAKDPDKQGLENSTCFNEGLTASSVPDGAKLVTQLTGYGPNGKYAALGYVYESLVLYGIHITNATGTFPLTNEMTKVYGDYGMDNGTAVLTNECGNLVLTLTGFKASNMSGVPIINASVADLTIVLDDESKLTGSFGSWDYGLLTVDGNLTIEGGTSSKLLVDNTNSSSYGPTSIYVSNDLMIDGAKVTATANSTSSEPYSIRARNDISIGQNSVVEATATSTSRYAYSISAGNDISIGKNTVVKATANCTSSSGAYSIYAYNDLKIESASKVNANAKGERDAYAMKASLGNISLGQNSVVEATATSTSSQAYSVYAGNDIKIASAKKVNATAESLGSGYGAAYGLFTYLGGAITITDSQDVTATATAPYAYSILVDYFYGENTSDIVIANSKVTAKANGLNNAFALWSHAGSIKITGDKTVIDANATCTGQAGSGAGAILAYEDITITSAERIKAIGTNSSFVYNGSGYGSLNIDELADYKFSNASVNGAEPKLYSTFVNSSNWYDSGTDIVSNFTAVLIEKKSTTPSSTGSSSKQTGYTVILQDTVVPADAADTSANMYVVNFSMNGHGIQVMNQSVSFGNTAEEPSPVPTADGYTFTGWYTDKGLVSKYAFSTPVTDDIELYAGWTAKTPTSKSPAPFVGIIAGLGAAAFVLARMRR